MINFDEHQKANASLINFVDKHRELVDENWNMRKLLEQTSKYLECMSADAYDLADCLCIEYHECTDALNRVAELEKQLIETKRELEIVKSKVINPEIAMELAHIYAVNSFRLGSYERIDILQNNGVSSYSSVELRDKCAANKEALLRYLKTGVK